MRLVLVNPHTNCNIAKDNGAIGVGVNLAQTLITAYQKHIRPVIPATCRFEPSCSEYAKQAILKYGIIKGVFKGITRICRCHPFCSRPSYDPLV